MTVTKNAMLPSKAGIFFIIFSFPKTSKPRQLQLRLGRCGYLQRGDCGLKRCVREVSRPAVNLERFRRLKLFDGLRRQWTILAVDLERRRGAQSIQRRLNPFHPDGVIDRRRGGGSRQIVVDAREHLHAELRQISDRLNGRRRIVDRLLKLRYRVHGAQDQRQQLNQHFHVSLPWTNSPPDVLRVFVRPAN
jgi:hypothetical protein